MSEAEAFSPVYILMTISKIQIIDVGNNVIDILMNGLLWFREQKTASQHIHSFYVNASLLIVIDTLCSNTSIFLQSKKKMETSSLNQKFSSCRDI